VLLVGYNLRFAPSLQFFAAQIAASRIGQVLSVRAEVGQYLPEWRPDADYRTGVSARQSLGGGVLLELSHEIDYLRWIFGSIDWVSAILRTQSTLEIDVEDTALLTLGFGGAGHAGLVASLCMDFVRRDATRTCTAIGELGTLRWDGGRATVSLYDPARNEWVTLFDTPPVPDETYIGEWQHFLECVEHGTSPLVGGHDGLEVLRIIEAARISSSAGGRITAVQGELRELAS
jgi:predicted dehydrogenase